MKNSEVKNTALGNKSEKANETFKSNGVIPAVKPIENQIVHPVKEEKVIPVDKNELSKDQNNSAEQSKSETVKENNSFGQTLKDESKAEPKTAQFAPNLDTTLKTIQDLHRKAVQRKNLIDLIDNLESFEIQLEDDADETETNYYTGCVLTIKDDNGKSFTIKNPTIIKKTTEEIKTMCTEKLAELEAVIVFPS